MCIFIETSTILAAAELFGAVMIFSIGFSLYLTDFISDLEANLKHLDLDLLTANRITFNLKERIKMKMVLFDVIRFHIEAKELSHQFLFKKTAFLNQFYVFSQLSLDFVSVSQKPTVTLCHHFLSTPWVVFLVFFYR